MKVLIRNAHIICESSPFHGQTVDILVNEGIITRISPIIDEETAVTIERPGLFVSTGWVDVFADIGEPGFEHRETLQTGAAAAAAGGFTDVFLSPNTSPVRGSKSQVEFVRQHSQHSAVDLHAIGAITKDCAGKDLSEMYETAESGAVAFSDGTKPIQNGNLLLKALQYVLPLNAVVIQVPDDQTIGGNGLMHEGIMSTQLGMPGKPALSEELMIARDLELLRYTNSRLHLTGVSTRKGLDQIRAAKLANLQVSVSVTAYHASFCDEDLESYDSNLKVNPPLRTRADMEAVREALSDGTIDCIASHHLPRSADEKECEFEYAKHGMEGLESTFPALRSSVENINALIRMLTSRPREIFSLPPRTIAEGESACLTIFDPTGQQVFRADQIRSKSLNNAFINKSVTGRVIGIINKHKLVLNNHEVN